MAGQLKKRSRARVTIEGQCVLLQISLPDSCSSRLYSCSSRLEPCLCSSRLDFACACPDWTCACARARPDWTCAHDCPDWTRACARPDWTHACARARARPDWTDLGQRFLAPPSTKILTFTDGITLWTLQNLMKKNVEKSKYDFATRFTLDGCFIERWKVSQILGLWVGEDLSNWQINTKEIVKRTYEEEQSQGYNRRTTCSFTNFSSNKNVYFFVK